ncbi:hypothetical protein [Mycolicibacterium arenosum]|uniref:Uncharacterized protein n=1 Tax=Mycolicibacterium arenosum TaxID=2952157 RepID=A0ABT1M065_9MYCO|nr:hypothetical protein [Mycolicibacterium sp. CAU 1645]MCP9272539.1 hypothetical protein [Mycolicibacterium sp. CAU 1645]
MTSKTSTTTGWRRAVTGVVASGALAAGLMIGLGATPALAEPATDATVDAEAPEAPQMTPDQALLAIQAKYDTGAGGGQVSNLINDVMKLRQQGFMPSNSNGQALIEALNFTGASQSRVIEALEATKTFQLRNKLRNQQAQSQSPTSIGINTLPPGNQGTILPAG